VVSEHHGDTGAAKLPDEKHTVHVGTICHVGHDKYALTAALAKIGAIDQNCCVVDPPGPRGAIPADGSSCGGGDAGRPDDPILGPEAVPGELGAQLEILWHICARGIRYFAEKQDSHGTDLFQHMQHEVGLLASNVKPARAVTVADRDTLGREVRRIWIEWAMEQPDPKSSWLLPWEALSESDREVDRRIGEGVAAISAAVAPSAQLADPSDPSWIYRASVCGSQIASEILKDALPVRGDGVGKNHLRWMADQIANRKLDSETKACRWLGYLQGSLVTQGLSTLECEKLRNLDSRAGAIALVREDLAGTR
jgi:hypothetical protein